MNDLRQRDLSEIPDHKLSAAERKELESRFFAFLEAMRGTITKVKKVHKKKRVEKWDPARHGSKH